MKWASSSRMQELSVNRGADGLFHPTGEDEVAALVRFAAANGRRLRVRGAGHSPPGAAGVDDPADVLVALDGMRELRVLDRGERLVEAQAGIHLGRDPAAGGRAGALESSLLWQLADRYGWTLASTGGITHQTLGGYLATASAGGTLQRPMLEQVVAIRLVDGRGELREFSRGDATPGLAAVLPSLGLLGVITAVTLRCEPVFTIAGQEAIVGVDNAAVDLTGGAGDDRPSLAAFLTGAEYARIEWWPQRGGERFLIWQAQRTTPQPGFSPTYYEEFTAYPVLAEAMISTLYVVFGNLARPRRARELLRRNADHVAALVDMLDAEGLLRPRSRRVAHLAAPALRRVAAATWLLGALRPVLEAALPRIVPALLDFVLPLDCDKPGMRRGEPQAFRDWGWHGLPMDNQASDVLLASAFSELWIPLPRAAQLMGILRGYFAEPVDAHDAFHRTGLFAYELYGAPAADGWLHPGYSDGADEWREGALRLDVYWFSDNAEDPMRRFFPQFWELLRDHEIPFRPHWGKQLPGSTPQDRGWVDLFASRYPRWEEFLALRAQMDPGDVFLTEYWRDRLGLWS